MLNLEEQVGVPLFDRLPRGHINLAVSHSSAEQLIPEVIESAMANHPGLTYSVRFGSGENILK